MEYRHELKFEVSDITLQKIKYRLSPIMQKDIHQNGNCYLIRSVYFDDYRDSCFWENEAGIDERRKYRIRIYNADVKYISFEKKSKSHGMTKKEQVSITKELCDQYLHQNIPDRIKNEPQLLKEFRAEQIKSLMHPVCIVEYERTALVYPIGNVRITFDRNIRSSSNIKEFYERKISGIPILEPDHQILEVKYDNFLPSFILQALNLDTLKVQSFSKYYYAREKTKMRRKL